MEAPESKVLRHPAATTPATGLAGPSISRDMSSAAAAAAAAPKKKSRRGADPANQKRRCVSTACVACRKRKSKCDGQIPSCAACSSVYGTECVYDPSSDHRRKGVYREKIDSMKARNSTLQILIEAILNAAEDDVPAIVKKIRTCDSLDTVAELILKEDITADDDEDDVPFDDEYTIHQPIEGERELARKMGELRLENGSVRFIGGTSHLIYLGDPSEIPDEPEADNSLLIEDPMTSWTEVTKDKQVIIHLMNMYWNWHYPYFTTLSKTLFYRDFLNGRGRPTRGPVHCSSLLVNAMLALGCHFTSITAAFATPGDSRTKGDHFFAEAKRLIVENDEYEKPRLTTVQALALMSVREAGCGREAKGWVYSGMSFRMAQDIGLNLDIGGLATDKDSLDEKEIDARRITFWGCFLFDKCWSNYLGRLPQLPRNTYNVPKFDVFPDEDSEPWCPYTDGGFDQAAKQPSRARAVALQLSKLCEISSDLLLFFYHPNHIGRSSGKSVELKKLSELHRRLEDWKAELPKELEPKDGQLPNVILVHMFYHLQYIHLFRPFLKYTPASSPLPAHVSPRRICTANAGAISKLMRLYKKMYNLRQICNIAVYMVHSACTIHMLNLPEKTAKRDVIHGVKHLEEIAEDWLCARRTLSIISVLARKWKVDMPEDAAIVLKRTDEKYGTFSTSDVPSPNNRSTISMTPSPPAIPNSPPTTSAQHDHYSPMNRYNQVTPPPMHEGLPTSTMSASMMSSMALAGMSASASMQNQLPRSMGPLPGINASLSGASSSGGGGGMSSMSINDVQNVWGLPQQAMSSHYVPPPPTYNPTPVSSVAPPQQQRSMGTASSSATSSRAGTRHVSPNSVYAIDGQDWYLKDAVAWHQNFEAWNLPTSNGAAASQSLVAAGGGMGSGGGGSGGGGGNASGGGGGGAASDPMYVFRGMRGEMDSSGFDGFGGMDSSLDRLDHLPGLD